MGDTAVCAAGAAPLDSRSEQGQKPNGAAFGSRLGASEEFETFWEELARDEGDAAGAANLRPSGNAKTEEGFSSTCEALRRVMENKPLQRESLYRVLVLCQERKAVEDVERTIEGYPEFPLIMQPAYRLIRFLIDGGGLRRLEIDSAGLVVSEERKTGLSADGIDDLVEAYMLETTDVGRAIACEYAPMRRMRRLFEKFPDRVGIYADLLELCCEPCTYADVEKLIPKERVEGLRTLNYEPGCLMKPSVFVDNLESSGALVWMDHRWHTTSEGKLVLRRLRDEDGCRLS